MEYRILHRMNHPLLRPMRRCGVRAIAKTHSGQRIWCIWRWTGLTVTPTTSVVSVCVGVEVVWWEDGRGRRGLRASARRRDQRARDGRCGVAPGRGDRAYDRGWRSTGDVALARDGERSVWPVGPGTAPRSRFFGAAAGPLRVAVARADRRQADEREVRSAPTPTDHGRPPDRSDGGQEHYGTAEAALATRAGARQGEKPGTRQRRCETTKDQLTRTRRENTRERESNDRGRNEKGGTRSR